MEPKIERGAAPDIHRIEDASVNWYLVEAEQGLTIVAGAATADSEWALQSLDARAAVEAGTVLTGHGEPWRGGTAEAVRRARAGRGQLKVTN
jgi:hypothetical protein